MRCLDLFDFKIIYTDFEHPLSGELGEIFLRGLTLKEIQEYLAMLPAVEKKFKMYDFCVRKIIID